MVIGILGIMEKKMETTIQGLGFGGLYRDYIGIVENDMKTTV